MQAANIYRIQKDIYVYIQKWCMRGEKRARGAASGEQLMTELSREPCEPRRRCGGGCAAVSSRRRSRRHTSGERTRTESLCVYARSAARLAPGYAVFAQLRAILLYCYMGVYSAAVAAVYSVSLLFFAQMRFLRSLSKSCHLLHCPRFHINIAVLELHYSISDLH